MSDFLTTVEAADVSTEAKNELIEKTLMDMVTMHIVLDKIDGSTTAASDWDKAAACYIGARTDSTTDVFTTYDRATKRAAADNFNTLESSGEASINAAIITALNSPGDASRTKIRELYQALYAQNVLKYAYEIDAKLAEGSSAAGTASNVVALGDLVAEGLAFWRILKPFIIPRRTKIVSMASSASTTCPPATPRLAGCAPLELLPREESRGRSHGDAFRWNRQRGGNVRPRPPPTGSRAMPRFPTGAESGDYTASGVTYTFTNDVGASLQFSEAIAEIRALLTSGAASADIESKYESLGLKGLADLPSRGHHLRDVHRRQRSRQSHLDR